jgi:serine/threonine protein kinase
MSKNTDNDIPSSIKSYKIEKETYTLSNINLYTATNTDINEKVLIHVFPKEQLKSQANEVSFMNNHVYLLKLLNHKNILRLFEMIETKKFAFLVFEYFEGEKLSDFIAKKKTLTEDESLAIFKELLSVISYLNEMNICNLNINSNNIIIDKNNNIKVCNFKFGHFYSNKGKSRTDLTGDYYSTCPELVSKKPYRPELADMWSAGVLLFQLVTGQQPFKAQKDLDLIRLIIKGNYKIPNTVSANMQTILKGLMEVNEEKRFKLSDLLNQQLLKDKKITKESFTPGLNILTTKYPIDATVLNICKNSLGLDVNNLIKSLENNRFTPVTSLFKQIVTKLISKGIQTINDLYSAKFLNYVNDTKYNLKSEHQIKNIQYYLLKEDEVKKNSQDVAAILLNNQNEISKGLEDLKRQYELITRGIEPLERDLSFGKKRRRRTFQLDRNEEIIQKLSNDANSGEDKLNVSKAKRNTVLLPEYGNLGKERKSKKKKKGELPNKPGGRFEGQKAIKEEKEKEDKSDNSVSSKSSHSSNSQEKEKKEKKEKKEEKKPTEFKKPELKKPELKKVEVKKEEKKQEFKMPQLKKVEVKKPEVKKEEKKVEEKKPNLIMNKNPQVPEQKVVKKILVNNQQSDIKFVKKTDNEKKVKINVKAEDNTRDDILKIRSQLKKGSGNKSTTDIGKKATTNKNEPQKASAFPGPFGGGGIKNLKEMFEANIKKQKSMGNIKGDPKAKK